MTGTAAAEFTCGRRARGAASLGERGRCPRLRARSRERVRQPRGLCAPWDAVARARDPERGRPSRGERGGEEVAQRAIGWMNPGAGGRGMGLDVRRGARAGGVEACVRPRGGAREPELQESGEETERSLHASVPTAAATFSRSPTPSLRSTPAPTSNRPYMHTISGPVGKSATYDTHKPSRDASAPEPHEISTSLRMSRVKRKAMVAGTTSIVNTISTPANGTEMVTARPKEM